MRVKRFVLPNTVINIRKRIKRILSYLYAYSPIGYLLVGLHAISRQKKTYQYEVSLCLIFKDEAPYLKEWLEYHILIGIDHFYLYNNNSTDNFVEILEPYIRSGKVTLTNWAQNYSQIGAYEHCYNMSKNETHWLGYLDTDEFFNLIVDGGGGNNIKEFLKKYATYPSVFFFWRFFGVSGIMKEDISRLVVEQFTSCWPYLCNTGKSFINNDYYFRTIGIHQQEAKYLGMPLYGIAVNKMFCPYMEAFPEKIKPKAYINHYWSKSLENAVYKTYKRTDPADKELEKIRRENGIDFFELQCADKDFSIQRWLVNLKEKLSDN